MILQYNILFVKLYHEQSYKWVEATIAGESIIETTTTGRTSIVHRSNYRRRIE